MAVENSKQTLDERANTKIKFTLQSLVIITALDYVTRPPGEGLPLYEYLERLNVNRFSLTEYEGPCSQILDFLRRSDA